MKAFVTGAAGFIGSHLVETLLAEGHEVRAMVRYNSRGTKGWLNECQADPKLEIKYGDLRDLDTLNRYIDGYDTVFHLGAMISIPYSYISPSEAHAVNTLGTFNVLSACRTHKVKKIIHTSTSEVYGTAQYVPIDEAHPIRGQSPYSASKTGADHLAESFYRTYDLPVCTIRPFNTYGPRQSARAVIPTIIVQGLTQNIIKLGSLNPTRDFTFVSDTVQGMILAAKSPESIGKVINLGVGSEISIGELVKKIESLLQTKLNVQSDSIRIRPEKSEVNRLLSNNTLAKKLLNWEPKVSLDAGLEQSIKWLKNNLGEYDRAQREHVV